jgi:hypothetical protein
LICAPAACVSKRALYAYSLSFSLSLSLSLFFLCSF